MYPYNITSNVVEILISRPSRSPRQQAQDRRDGGSWMCKWGDVEPRQVWDL